MKRECFPCTACCEGWLVGEIDGRQMKPGIPCQHCTDSGCAIYDRRPVDPCRNFNCSWVKDNSPLPDNLKPNECGVIIKLNQSWQGMKVHSAIPTGEKLPHHVLDFLTAYARETSTPLKWTENVIKDGKVIRQKGRGYGPQSFIKAIEEHLKTEDFIEI